MSPPGAGIPAPERRRTKPADERRADLLRAAERLFLEKGVEGCPVDEIAAAAGVAKGTFYLHFRSKGEVVEALRAGFVADLVSAVEVAVEAAGKVAGAGAAGPPARLAAWARACARFYLEASALHHLVFAAAPAPPREGLVRNPVVEHLAGLLAEGVAEGAWQLESVPLTAAFLFAALHGVVDGAAGFERALGRQALLDLVAAQFLRAGGIGPGNN